MNLSRLTQGKKPKGRPKHESLESVIGKRPGNGQEEAAAQDLAHQRAAEDKDREKLLKPYDDGLPFDLARYTRRIQGHGALMLEAAIEIGKDLIRVRAELEHGQFASWLDESLSMSHQRASECMRIAQRTVESGSPDARRFLLQMAAGSKSKMLMLLDVSDGEAEAAMESGEFLGKPTEEVPAMSFREMAAALKKEKDRNLRNLQEKDDYKQKYLNEKARREAVEMSRAHMPSTRRIDLKWLTVQLELTDMVKLAREFSEEHEADLMQEDVLLQSELMLRGIHQAMDAIRRYLVPEEAEEIRKHIITGAPLRDPSPKLSMVDLAKDRMIHAQQEANAEGEDEDDGEA